MRMPFAKTLRGVIQLPKTFTASLLFSVFLISSPSSAMNIEKVVSPKGIEAWLVEDHTLPMIAVQFGFHGGSAQDPAGKEGLAFFVSGMMDEGAGDIESQAFQEKLQELAIDMSFESAPDAFTGGIKTLSENKDEAFRLLGLALKAPRMDEDAVDRVRHQILAIIKSNSEDPEAVARETWLANVFDDHPYGRPEKGTEATLGALTPEDLKGYVKDNFARSNLKIAVVGDITAEQLAAALDGIFGDLPENPKLAEVPEAKWEIDGSQLVVPMATPQTVVTFGFPGPKRHDPDFYAAYVLNNIVGGGGFSSRLMEEVREKRGLAYSAYTYLNPLDHAGISMGGVATKNERVRESIEVIKSVFEDIAKNGPTEQELEDAKRYLTGSYALRFSSSTRIASIVLWVQLEDLGMDYIEKRNGLIESVQLEDIKRAASLIDLKDMFITIVGQPDGIEMLGKPAASNSPPRG